MNLLKTVLVYLSLIFSVSAQNMADTELFETATAPTPTPYVTAAPTTPAPTQKPTPVPTIAITPNPDYKTLRVGDSGDAVRELQQKLSEYGYYTGDIDGRYGNQTRRSVEKFQYAHGLSADGIAGKATLTVLYESNEVRFAENGATPTPVPSATPAPAEISLAPAAVTAEEEKIAAPEVTAEPVEETEPDTKEAAVKAEEPAASAEPQNEEQPAGFTPIALTEDGPAEEAENIPSATEAPFVSEPTLMEGYKLLANGDEPVVSGEDEETPLYPCFYGSDVYLPLTRILSAAGINVLYNMSIEEDEIAFVIGDDIMRLTYSQNQAGDPINLQVFRGIEPQIVQNRQMLGIEGNLYLSAETITSITGAAIETDEENLVIRVTVPLPEDEEE